MYTVKFNDQAAEKSGDSNPADIIRDRERDIFPNDMCIYVNNVLMSNWKSFLTSPTVFTIRVPWFPVYTFIHLHVHSLGDLLLIADVDKSAFWTLPFSWKKVHFRYKKQNYNLECTIGAKLFPQKKYFIPFPVGYKFHSNGASCGVGELSEWWMKEIFQC